VIKGERDRERERGRERRKGGRESNTLLAFGR